MNPTVHRLILLGVVLTLVAAGCSKGESADKLLLQGEAKENSGDVADALALYEQALKERPNDAALHVHIAQAAYKLNQPERGIQAIDKLKTIDFPGKDLAELEKMKAAFDAMRKATVPAFVSVQTNPSTTRSPATALAIQTAKSAMEDAQATLQRNFTDAELRYAALCFAREAHAALKEEISKPEQNDIELWFQAGRVALARGEDRLAALAFEAIQRLRPDYNTNNALLDLMAKLNRRPIKPYLAGIMSNRQRFLSNLDAGPHFAQRWTNSLGMRFVPVSGIDVLFCVWEVRRGDYAAYARANPGIDNSWQNPEFDGVTLPRTDIHPVVCINWDDARAFCNWLTQKEKSEGLIGDYGVYRLPTDAEWSAAVGLGRESGISPKDKSDSNSLGREVLAKGNIADNTFGKSFTGWREANRTIEQYEDGFATLAPVGSFETNQFGLCDLDGNVSEWCEDWFDADKKSRTTRGGSFNDCLEYRLRPSCRMWGTSDIRTPTLGFRCVVDLNLLSRETLK